MVKTSREFYQDLTNTKFSVMNQEPMKKAANALIDAVIDELEDLRARVQIIEDAKALDPSAPGWPRARPDGV